MEKQDLIEAYQRELAGAVVKKQRDRVVLIEAELKALGVSAPAEATGSGDATKRARKTTAE
jgi:hypothetical protein